MWVEESVATIGYHIAAGCQAEEDAAPMMVMDASFNFAVDESDHSFQETADVTGERAGSYSFLTPDGQMLEVRYTAGKNGFVILNPEEVLPQQVL